MPERPDLDEPISLHPHKGEDVLRRLLGADEVEDEPIDDEDDA